jgi:hypothetical protein
MTVSKYERNHHDLAEPQLISQEYRMSLDSKDPSVNVPGIAGNKFLNNRQTMFVGYMLCVLVDLVVLNLFVEFWDRVIIDSFLLSLLTAVLLQLLLKLVLRLEHKSTAFFNARPGGFNKFMRWFAAWVLIFGSKFVMLELVDLVFGDHVKLGGIVAFYAVIFSIIIAEYVVTRIYYMLADE